MSELLVSSEWATLKKDEYRALSEHEFRQLAREHSSTDPVVFDKFLKHGGLVEKFGHGCISAKELKEQQAAANKFVKVTAHQIAKCNQVKKIFTMTPALQCALRLKALGVPLLDIEKKTGIGGRKLLRAQERIDAGTSVVGKNGRAETILPMTVINAITKKANANEQGNTGWTFETFYQIFSECWKVDLYGPKPALKTLKRIMLDSWPAKTNTKLVSTDARKHAHADILTSLNWASFLQYVKRQHLADLRHLRQLAGLPDQDPKDEHVNSKLFCNVDTTSCYTFGQNTVNKKREDVYTTTEHKLEATKNHLSIVKPKMEGNCFFFVCREFVIPFFIPYSCVVARWRRSNSGFPLCDNCELHKF